MTQAQATGEPVEVTDSTTETSQVFANPDGTFTLKSNQRPVRVQQDGVWRPIDTTLHVNPDGSVSPTATDQDVVFSGGGTAPLVTVRHAGKALAFTWPTPLPQPAVDGDTATYPGVFPGVDLRVIARADSYSQVLVVHNAEAAANPALAQLRMTVTGTGLNLRIDDAGSLVAEDPDGVDVMRGAPPLMWDSRIDDRVGPEPSDIDPGSGRVTPLEVATATQTSARSAAATSATTLTVTPEPESLTGPDVVYPLYIDPSMGVRKQHWSIITDNGWAPQYDSDVLAQVGYCSGWPGCNGAWRARSYFLMPTGDLQHRNGTQAEIYRAEFYANQVWSADHDCSGGRPTTVRESSSFNSGANWPGPAGRVVDTEYSNAGGPCPAANLRFDVSSSARITAANSYSVLALALVAADENVPEQWKKFDNNPLLEVDFSFPPNQAVNLRVSNEIRCTGTPITPDARPTIYSTATDNNDPPLNLRLGHEVWNSAHTTMRSNTPAPSPDVIASGATGNWRIPTVIGDGAYALRSSAQNIYPGYPGRDKWGPWSTWYPFSIDATPPPTAPTVGAAEDYPRGYWGAPSGAPGLVPVSTPDTDAVGYAYTFNGSGTQTVPGSADCNYYRAFGTGGASGGWLPNTTSPVDWIPIPTGLTAGYHTIHVKTFDNAHNMSAESTAYTFYVAPNTGLSALKLEAETLPRSQPTGQNSTVAPQSNCCNVTWSGNSQLSFNATAAGQSATVSFTVGTESDYQLALAITKATNYGIASFQLDGTTIGGSFDGYATKVYNTHLPLGTRKLTAGTHTLTITTTGTNPASSGARYVVGIDYLTLTQTTRHQAERLTTHQPDGQNVPLTREISTGTGPGPFSEQEQLKFAATSTGQSFGLDFRVPIEADYAIGAALSAWTNYGQVRIQVDDTPLLKTDTTPWDGYASSNGNTTYQPLGGAHLTAGTHSLTITVVGKNPSSTGYLVGIDYLTAIPVNNVTTANFTTAMNNNGIAEDGTTASLDLNGASLSAQTLAAAGYGPGASAMVNGATFTMPTPRSDESDNVIAIGQRIPLPSSQRVKANAVTFLVTSTCGKSPVRNGKLTFTDGTYMNVRFPEVPDWISTIGPDLLTLPYRNEGTTSDPTSKPTLFTISVPSDPTKTLDSITLPNYGSSLLTRTCSGPSLHVLSMAPRPVATGWLGAWTAYARRTSAPPAASNNFADQTLRTVIAPSITGESVRIRLANTHSPTPVTFDSVSIAAQSGTGAAAAAPPTALRFGGSTNVTIPGGAEVYSDPVPLPPTTSGPGKLLVSIHVPTAVTAAPNHNTFHSPTYIASGNATADSTGTPFTTQTQHYWYVSGIEVTTTDPQAGTVAVLGDNLSVLANPLDGPSWTDQLPAELATAGATLPGGLVNASSRDWEGPDNLLHALDHTVLNQPNLRTVIIALGSDSLTSGGNASAVKAQLTTLISSTSVTGIRNYRRTDGTPVHVILMTVPPLHINDPHPEQEAERQYLNTDIRANYTDYGAHEIIDIAAILEDPTDPSINKPEYFDVTTWDHLPAYFTAIARTVAYEATRFPPGAQL